MTDFSLWGEARIAVTKAIYSAVEGVSGAERVAILEEIVALVRALSRGDRPQEQTSPFDRDEHAREVWARHVAGALVGTAMHACERIPSNEIPPHADTQAVLREICRYALWHMRNAEQEARDLVRYATIARLKQPHPGDDPIPPGAAK